MTRSTWTDRGLLTLRAGLGAVFMAHGLQKLLVMGVGGVEGFLTSLGVPLPGVNAVLLIGTEVVGGLLIAVGGFTRVAALASAFAMLVATLLVHLPNGFFLPGGYEFTMMLGLASLALVMTGPGSVSLDARFAPATPVEARPALPRAA
jgi:putative oxidoreductase